MSSHSRRRIILALWSMALHNNGDLELYPPFIDLLNGVFPHLELSLVSHRIFIAFVLSPYLIAARIYTVAYKKQALGPPRIEIIFSPAHANQDGNEQT